jgi:hypothetical protein
MLIVVQEHNEHTESGLSEGAGMPGVYELHGVTHLDVSEWAQHLRQLQTEIEFVPYLQAALPECAEQSP